MARGPLSIAVPLAALPIVASQQVGMVWPEEHPPLPLQICKKADGCAFRELTSVTLDAGRRWLHDARWVHSSKPGEFGNCGGIGFWNETLCPDAASCARNCALDGLKMADYEKQYGVSTTADDGIRISYVTGNSNVGSRLFMMDGENEDKYRVFHLKNKELSFDVDVSTLECGMNAAVYFVEMPSDGGKGLGHNFAGAMYGLGYCDARCPTELAFVNGNANMDGTIGSCCTEMDIFEGNKVATSMTAHPCSVQGLTECTGIDCGDGNKHKYYKGVCDKDGCEYNPYRLGDKGFYGQGGEVDTKKKITVVTQFVTVDGTDTGELSHIRRLYLQDGKVIGNPGSMLPTVPGHGISSRTCTREKTAFIKTRDSFNIEGSYDQFDEKGGLHTIGDSLERGMVLVLALWDDTAVHMEWLDSLMPKSLSPDVPGALRGPCKPEWGNPDWMRQNEKDMYTEFSNFKYGDIGTTYADGASGASGGGATDFERVTGLSSHADSRASSPSSSSSSSFGALRKAAEPLEVSKTASVGVAALALASVSGLLVLARRAVRNVGAASSQNEGGMRSLMAADAPDGEE